MYRSKVEVTGTTQVRKKEKEREWLLCTKAVAPASFSHKIKVLNKK